MWVCECVGEWGFMCKAGCVGGCMWVYVYMRVGMLYAGGVYVCVYGGLCSYMGVCGMRMCTGVG